MTHLDIVKLLVTNKADIQKPNFNGGTCLINRSLIFEPIFAS
jgi:hypothetical protein